MAILSNPSGAFPTALVYITLGTLIDIWTGVAWLFYPPESPWGKFLTAGFAATGFALLLIGFFLGQIGRAARNAELPPAEVTASVEQAEQRAANHPAVVIPGNVPVQTPALPGAVAPVAPAQIVR